MTHSTNRAYYQRWWASLLSVALLLTVGLTTSQAQMKVRPGVMDTCYASPEIMNTRVHAEHMMAESPQLQQARTAAVAEVPPVKTAEFIVNYTGFTPEAEAAFQYAVDIWATILVSDVPIRVDASFQELPPNVLGSAGPTFIFSDFDESVKPETWYISALADAIAGEDLAETIDSVVGAPDLRARFSSTFDWYYGTDLNTPSDQYDFVSVVLHELGHGLGFIGGASYTDSTGIGEVRIAGLPIIYSDFVENSGDTAILSLPDSSKILGDFLTSNDLFMNGENTVEAYDGREPKIYAPTVWRGGSSYSHWDEDSFPAGDPNSLMSPQFGFAESIHQVGEITKGLFEDMGWTINEEPVTLISLRHTVKAGVNGACLGATPNTDEVGILPGGTACLYYTVTNVGDLPLTLHTLRDTQSGLILFNVKQDLAPGESLTVTRQIRVRERDLPITNVATWTASQPGVTGQVSATAVAKLFYAPVASIRPRREVSVRLEPDARKTRNLNIANRGGSPLTYRTVIRETDRTLEERVAESQAAVAELSSVPGISTEASLAVESSIAEMYGSVPPSYQGEALRTVQFATDFEDFEVGPLGTQNGWFATDSLAQISEESPFSGSKHLRMLSDSTAEDQYSVFSPIITGGTEPLSSFAMKLKLNGAAQYRIFPSSFSDAAGPSIGGALRIQPDGSLFIFDPTAGYVFSGYVLPEGYVDFKYVVNRVNGTFDFYVNDQLLAQEIIYFENDINFVEVRYYGGSSEASLDIDDFELIDGDAAAPSWVFVDPPADTVEVRSRLRADIIFDSEGLEPGVYQAEITIITNDPFNPSAVVPVKMTVKGDRRPPVVQPLYLRELVLVDADANRAIAPLKDGDVLDLDVLPAISVEAIPVRGFRGAIEFYVDGEFEGRQRYAPYALAGDVPAGNFVAYDFTAGTYEVTAVAIVKGDNGQDQTDSLSVSIRVIGGDQNSVAARNGAGLEGTTINPEGLSYQTYPNPVAQRFTVQSPNASDPIAHYTLIDNLGRTLVSKAVNNATTLEVDITSHLNQIRNSGIFYLRLMTVEGRSETMRLQIE